MTIEQELHLSGIKRGFESLVDIKYGQGQVEHGGDSWGMPDVRILNKAISEAVDQVIYLLTLRDKLFPHIK